MQVYNSLHDITPNHFTRVIAGSFYQLQKDCLMQLQTLLQQDLGSWLFIDVYPRSTDRNPMVLLSARERMLLLQQMGVRHYLTMDGVFFNQKKEDLNTLIGQGNDINITYLCGLDGMKVQNLDFILDISPKEHALFNWTKTLGFVYLLSGKVVHGNQIGRTLGFPTTNVLPDSKNKIIPPMGVYTGWVKCSKGWYQAMINIGIRPTLDLNNVTIEAHIFDFDFDLYGQEISLHFYRRIRNEMRFSSLQELKEQLQNDRLKSLEMLREAEIIPDESHHILVSVHQ